MRKLLVVLMLTAGLTLPVVTHATPRPIMLTVDRLNRAERFALDVVLVRVLTEVLGTDAGHLVSAKVRYSYEAEPSADSVSCEYITTETNVPGLLYQHGWHGIEELFRQDLIEKTLSAFFMGYALHDTFIFVRVSGVPEIVFMPVPEGTLIAIAPMQVIVYREYTDA